MEEVRPHYSFVWEKMDEASMEVMCRVATGCGVGNKDRHVAEELSRRGYLRDENGKLAVFSSSFQAFACEPGQKVAAKKGLFSLPWGKTGKK